MAGKTEKQLAIFALIDKYNEDHPDRAPYNPVLRMIEFGEDPTKDDSIRFNAHKTVAEYVYPKRRAEDEHGDPGRDYTIHVMNYSETKVLNITSDQAALGPSFDDPPDTLASNPVLVGEIEVADYVTLPVEGDGGN